MSVAPSPAPAPSLAPAPAPSPTPEKHIESLLASPEPLRRWLADACAPVAGLAKSSRLCPLAQFLAAQLPPDYDIAIYSRTIVIYGDDPIFIREDYALPAWAHAFVGAVDTLGALSDIFLAPVPRDEALALLDEIAPRQEPAQERSE